MMPNLKKTQFGDIDNFGFRILKKRTDMLYCRSIDENHYVCSFSYDYYTSSVKVFTRNGGKVT